MQTLNKSALKILCMTYSKKELVDSELNLGVAFLVLHGVSLNGVAVCQIPRSCWTITSLPYAARST